jgi:hypothetical protein
MKEKSRRLTLVAASVLVMGALLTGCSGGGGGGGTTANKPTTPSTPTTTATPEPSTPTYEVNLGEGVLKTPDGSYMIVSKTTNDDEGNTIKTLTKTVDIKNSTEAASQILEKNYVVAQEEVTTDASGNITQIKQTLAIDASKVPNGIEYVAELVGIELPDEGFVYVTLTYTYESEKLTNVTAEYEGKSYTVNYETGTKTLTAEDENGQTDTEVTNLLGLVAQSKDVTDIVSALSDEALDSAKTTKNLADTYLTVKVLYEGTCGDNLTWTLDNAGTLTISGTGAMEDMSYNDRPWSDCRSSIKKIVVEEGVTSISAYAFMGYAQTSVKLPDSLETIGALAFWNCAKLTSINIPKATTTIGNNVFAYCTNLETITVAEGNTAYKAEDGVLLTYDGTKLICCPAQKAGEYTVPEGVTELGSYAFEGCKKLTNIQLPSTLEVIDSYAFADCTGLTSIIIPDGTTSIGWTPFFYCSNLEKITVPRSVTDISEAAFATCESLKEIIVDKDNACFTVVDNVLFTKDKTSLLCYPAGLTNKTYTVPEEVKWIGSGAFAGSKLTEITLPAKLEGIDTEAFEMCSNLTSIAIPEGTTTIGSQAFNGCENLAKVTVPYTVVSIGNLAFDSCSEKLVVTYAGSEDQWKALYGSSYTFTVKCLDNTDSDNVSATKSGSCGAEGSNVKWTLDSEGTLTISGTGAMMDVTSSASWPWNNYRQTIKKIEVKEGVTSIGTFAFMNCAMTSIELPNTLTKINYGAFVDCRNLTEIVIPAGVKEIENNAFQKNTNLTTLTVDKNNTAYMAKDNVLFTKDEKTLVYYPTGLTGTYEMPDSVTCIGSYAFEQCSQLTGIKLSTNLITIDFYAFRGCTGLTSIDVPSKTTTIRPYAFRDCEKLEKITLPLSVTFVGVGAFDSCSTNLEVTYAGFKEQWEELYKGGNDTIQVEYLEHVEVIGSGYCGADEEQNGENLSWELKSDGTLTITGKGEMKYMGSQEYPWKAYSDRIKTIEVGEGVTSIREYAFSNCMQTSITLPESLETIEAWAFYNCTRMKEIRIPANVTYIGRNVFRYDQSLATITVDKKNENYCAEDNVLFKIETIPDDETNETLYEKTLVYCPTGLTGTYLVPTDVTRIGDGAFEYSQLTEIILPESLTTIDADAFKDCDKLTSMHIPSKTTYIDSQAFYKCSNMKTITVDNENTTYTAENGVLFVYDENLTPTLLFYCPDAMEGPYEVREGVKFIGNNAFAYCRQLTNITLPTTLEQIDWDAFVGCTGLTEITIPNGTLYLGADVFKNCSNLEKVAVPLSIKYIGSHSFSGCSENLSVTYDGFKTQWDKIYGGGDIVTVNCLNQRVVMFSGEFDADEDGKKLTWKLENDGTLTISGDGAMGNVTWPWDWPWYNYREEIQKIVVDEGVTSIADYAFFKCAQTSVVLPSTLKTIEDYAFEDCSNLIAIEIPSETTSVSANAFVGCENLITLTVASDNENYTAEDNVLFTKDKKTLVCYPAGLTGEYTVPDGVTSIGSNAFSYVNKLTTVTLPNSVTSMGDFAFAFNKMTNITLPDSLKTIGNYAFAECDNLTNIVIPDHVETIGEMAFMDCQSLESVQFPSSVKAIGYNVFYECSEKLVVTYCGSKEDWEKVERYDDLDDVTLKFSVETEAAA